LHITLRQLRIFEAVARHGSMSLAANELHLSQPAVSMQVKQLEDQIGLPLVEKVGRRMVLTEIGLELRTHAQRFTALTHELQGAMDQFRGLHRGILRLAVVSTACYFLPPLIARLNERYPGVSISLEVGNRDAVFGALAENRAHLAISGQPPDSDQLIAQAFMDNPLVVIAAPTHRLGGARSIKLARLSEETLVVRESGSGTRAAVERFFADRGVSYTPGCELSTNEAVKQAVRAGLGLGIVSAQTIELELQANHLVVLPVEGFPIVKRWYVVRRKEQRLSAAASAFRDVLLEARRSGERLTA
jgi:molybdate transport repressor ModE-like protein